MPSAADSETEVEETITDEAREALLEAVTSELGDAVVAHHLVPGRDLWVRVGNDAWGETADYLRNRQRFRFFDWLSAVDWLPSPFGRSLDATIDEADDDEDETGGFAENVTNSYAGGETRFQVMARVYSLATGIGITVKADVGDDLAAPTWIDTYPGAAWHEREVFEMFGIGFTGHAGLRNLYLPGDFEGNPLRKDFPLLARLIKPWPGIVDVEPMPPEPSAPNEVPASPEHSESASTENPEAG